MWGGGKRKGGIGGARPRLTFRLLARGAEGCIRGFCCEGEALTTSNGKRPGGKLVSQTPLVYFASAELPSALEQTRNKHLMIFPTVMFGSIH